MSFANALSSAEARAAVANTAFDLRLQTAAQRAAARSAAGVMLNADPVAAILDAVNALSWDRADFVEEKVSAALDEVMRLFASLMLLNSRA
jgi:hypothetical protein